MRTDILTFYGQQTASKTNKQKIQLNNCIARSHFYHLPNHGSQLQAEVTLNY